MGASLGGIPDVAIAWKKNKMTTTTIDDILFLMSSKKKCLRCHYKWDSHVSNPKRCPHCISPYWNKPYQIRQRKIMAESK